MLSLLASRAASRMVPADQVQSTYLRLRMRALFGIFFGYMAYYLVRSNFTLSTPYLQSELGFSKTDIGLLSTCMLITYGISKGVMSSLADKANPKLYMVAGLLMSACVNLVMGFSTAFWMFTALVIANGIFQGMGVGPAFITIANWFPRASRGRIGAFWNVSHNLGGGLVAPIAGVSLALFGSEHWQGASYWAPAAIATTVAFLVLFLGAGLTYNEGLPPLKEILPEEAKKELVSGSDHAPENMSAKEIFRKYVLKNKNVWYVSLLDVFVYMVRFGVITWLPLYLLHEKDFSKAQMGFAYAFFEWAAIPSTLLAGYVTDRYFRGRRMPLAIVCMAIIFCALTVYWQADSLLVIGAAVSVIGCLIYVPQFLASVQTIEFVPGYAVGSATGLRGILSYVLGASLGASMFGVLVDRFGWHAGFYLLLGGALMGMVFGYLTHRGAMELENDKSRLDAEAKLAEAAA
ncbi:MFS transporter [Xenophilus sp. AP218F]|nr:MFS transporter [Chromobacterium sp. ASV5]OWY38084.1 MFS transporter [Xenophilus sp. AP218F]